MKNTSKFGGGLKLFFVFFLAIFLIVLNPYDFFSPVRSFVHSVFMPLIQVGFRTGKKFTGALDTLKSIGTLKQENENLTRENSELKFKINELRDIKNENDALRKELNIKARQEMTLLGAEIIFKDISGKSGWFEINVGSNDGIEKGMPVIVGEKSVIGFVDEVFANYSRVRSINNSESLINVVTVESNVEAVAKGEHSISILVEGINQDANVEVGMTFITSQISGKFPRGLTVGVVQSVFNSDDGLYKNARIIPQVDFNDLRFVSVMLK